MHIPSFRIILPCLVSFGLAGFRYYEANPDDRLTDRRFVLAAGSIAAIFAFLMSRVIWPDETWIPVGFLLVALCLLGLAVRMFRQPLHPPEEPAQRPTTG